MTTPPYNGAQGWGTGPQRPNGAPYDDQTVLAPSGAPPSGQPQFPGQAAPTPPGQQQYPGPVPQHGYGQPSYPGQQPPSGGQPPQGPAYASRPPQPPKKGRGAGFWAAVIGIPVVLLALAIVAALVLGIRPGPSHGPGESPATDPTGAGSSTTSAAGSAGSADKPELALRGYFEALRDGDSKRAISYLDTQPTDAGMLTDEVLKNQKANNQGVTSVDTVTPTSATVKVGSKTVTLSPIVVQVAGKYKVKGLVTLTFLNTIPLKIDGAAVYPGSQSLLVFPGLYEVKADSPNVEFATPQILDATSWSTSPRYEEKLQPTAAGKAALLAKAKASVQDCLAQKASDPPNCPFAWTVTNGTLYSDTIQTSMQGADPLDSATWTIVGGKATASDLIYTFHQTARGKRDDGEDGPWDVTDKFRCAVTLDVSSGEPKNPTWSHEPA